MNEIEEQKMVLCKPNDNIPYVGMEFSSEDEAYKFYNDHHYSKVMGFSVRKDKYQSLANGTIKT